MVASRHHYLISNGFHAHGKTVAALCCLIPSADLVVVECVFSRTSVGERLGMHTFAPAWMPFFPALWVDGSKGCGGRKQSLGKHQTKDAKEKKGSALKVPGA